MALQIFGGSAAALSNTFVAGRPGFPPNVGPFSRLMTLLDEGEQSVALNLVGDSVMTTVGKTRWPALVASALAAKYPTYAVQTVTWNGTSQDFDAPVIVSGTPSARALAMNTNTGYQHPGSGQSITGDIDVRARVNFPAWPVASNGTILSRGNASVFSWVLGTHTTGKLTFQWTTDGSASPGQKLSSVIAPTPGTPIWVRATLTASTGLVSFYTSTDGTNWTAAGTSAGTATSLYDPANTVNYQLGVVFNTGTLGAYTFHEGEVRNGIGGLNVIPRYFDSWSANSNTVTVPGTLAGKPVLTVVIGAEPGASLTYLSDPTRLPKLTPVGYGYTSVIASISHNDTNERGAAYLTKWDTLLTLMKARTAPVSDFAILLQNPRISPASNVDSHRIRQDELLGWARRNGVAVLDAYRAFKKSSTALSSLVDPTDGIHPTDASGSPLMASVVLNALYGLSA